MRKTQAQQITHRNANIYMYEYEYKTKYVSARALRFKKEVNICLSMHLSKSQDYTKHDKK